MLPCALALSLALSAAPPLDCGELKARHFADARQAFEAAIDGQPAAIGIGEYHEVSGKAPKVKSAIKRFAQSMLPALKGKASHLIAETWIVDGSCGRREKQAVQQIEKQTQRPAQTEDEVATMLGTASDLGIEPHILKVECEDYQDLLDAQGEVDAEKLLLLVTRLLGEKAEALAEREKSGRAIVLYGGALHNELMPTSELAAFSYAPSLNKLLAGKYRQLTLVVPEYVEGDNEAAQEPWWSCFQKYATANRVLLIQRGADASWLVFPKTARSKAP